MSPFKLVSLQHDYIQIRLHSIYGYECQNLQFPNKTLKIHSSTLRYTISTTTTPYFSNVARIKTAGYLQMKSQFIVVVYG